MDSRLQKRVQRYGWDRASEDYARYWQAQLEPVQTRLLEVADLQAAKSCWMSPAVTGWCRSGRVKRWGRAAWWPATISRRK